MIETPHISRFSAPHIVSLHVMTPRAQIQQAMHAALHEVTAALESQDVKPVGPWFAHHHRRPTDIFDFDVCFPVAQPITLSGRLANGSVAEIEVARTAYHGPYEGLPQAWPAFVEWINAHGHTTREDAFEVYSIGPREHPDPEAWQTDLIYPLASPTATRERIA